MTQGIGNIYGGNRGNKDRINKEEKRFNCENLWDLDFFYSRKKSSKNM